MGGSRGLGSWTVGSRKEKQYRMPDKIRMLSVYAQTFSPEKLQSFFSGYFLTIFSFNQLFKSSDFPYMSYSDELLASTVWNLFPLWVMDVGLFLLLI